ncbi:hypothetical protein ACFGVR_08915 [Mucilaginibacter sp. AW1-3]
MQKLKTFLSIISVCLLFVIAAKAQKLPNIQQGSVRAPADIKIDGKVTEWDNQFKAYNHATDIFYTLSNDDENLYLTVQATDGAIIRKINSGGVCLTIQPSGKKNDKDGMRVVYPVIIATTQGKMAGRVIMVSSVRRSATPNNEQPSEKEADSVMAARNKQFSQRAKWIGALGFKDLDSLISVYNEDGLKAAGRYDNKGVFTCEIAISLKRIGFSVDKPIKFSYHILLNGVSMFGSDRPVQAISIIGGGMPMPMSSSEGGPGMTVMMDGGGGAAPTDFWGEYTLAKK